MRAVFAVAVLAILVAGCGSGGGGKGGNETTAPTTASDLTTTSKPTTAGGTTSHRLVGKAPTATFTFTPAAPAPGDNVTFKGKGTDTDGTIKGYAWDFGDGTKATTQNATHAFTTEGTFDVTLTVTDDKDNPTPLTKPVIIKAKPPAPAFDWLPKTAAPGDTVSFYSTSRDDDGTIVSYDWDFNDGGTATGRNVTHVFDVPGSFSVLLDVKDDDGAVASISKTIAIAAVKPTANFAFSPSAPAVGQSVTFTSISSDPDGTIASCAWDFKDGDKGTGETATHSFAFAGTYAVVLTVTDDDGATAQKTQNVVVH